MTEPRRRARRRRESCAQRVPIRRKMRRHLASMRHTARCVTQARGRSAQMQMLDQETRQPDVGLERILLAPRERGHAVEEGIPHRLGEPVEFGIADRPGIIRAPVVDTQGGDAFDVEGRRRAPVNARARAGERRACAGHLSCVSVAAARVAPSTIDQSSGVPRATARAARAPRTWP